MQWKNFLVWAGMALSFAITVHCVEAQAQSYQPLAPSTGKAVQFPTKFCLGYWGNDFKCSDGSASAILFEPEAPWSAVVLISHGSQGVDQRHFEYADALKKSGFAAAVIDHWTPRGVNQGSQDYTQFTLRGGTTSSIATDSIYLAQHLKTLFPNIKKVGFIGESMGGIAVLQLAKQRMVDLFTTGTLATPGTAQFEIPFQAMAGLYPACLERVVGERFNSTPVLFLVGEKDDHTLASHCVEYQDWMNSHGGNAKTIVVPGTYHDFDSMSLATYKPRSQNLAKCRYIVTGSTMRLVDSGKELPYNLAGQAQLPRECSRSGITSGHSGNRFIAVPLWLDFFKAQL